MFEEVKGHQKVFDQIQSILTFDDSSGGPHRFILLNSGAGSNCYYYVEDPAYVVGYS